MDCIISPVKEAGPKLNRNENSTAFSTLLVSQGKKKLAKLNFVSAVKQNISFRTRTLSELNDDAKDRHMKLKLRRNDAFNFFAKCFQIVPNVFISQL